MSGPDQPAWARESVVLRLGEGDGIGVEITPEWAFAGSTGAGVRVAIVDSGIDADHPRLGGCVDVDGSVDVAVGDDGTVVIAEGPHRDVFGHGTACAGIIHALAPEARITSVRVLGPSLTGTAAAFHAGLAWAVDAGFDVINLSLGTGKKDWALAFHEVCDRAYFGGSFVVTAANNVARASYPSLFASVASVACNTSTDPLRFHANPEPPTEFLARGIDVEVPWLDGGSTVTTGNSYAAPHIAAFATLIKSKHPELRPFQVKAALWATAANVREASVPEVAGRRATMHAGGARGTAMTLVRPVRAGATTVASTAAPTSSGATRRRRSPVGLDDTSVPPPTEADPVASPAGFTVGQVTGRWRWGLQRAALRDLDGRPVALHDLPAAAAAADAVRAAVREVDAAVAATAHPNLVPVLDWVEDPPALVTAPPVRLDPDDRPAALAAARTATGAMAAAHRAGLVHGDLRPAWLGRAPDGSLVVAGTGLAPVLGTVAPAAATALHPDALVHLAPEQLGDHQPTPATDVYALALLWCRLLTGALPWPEATSLGTLLRQRLTTPPRPTAELASDLPVALAGVLDRSLAADPSDRPPDAVAFAELVDAALGRSVGQ